MVLLDRDDANIEIEGLTGERMIEVEHDGLLADLVHPNLAPEPRVSISFNLVLRWSDDYLPRQD